MKSIIKLHQHYDQRNAESAAMIMADPQRYPIGSGLRLWAERYQERMRKAAERNHGGAVLQQGHGQQDLF